MAKYKVLKNFNDKYTKVKYKVGDVVDFTEERAREILLVGNLIEKVIVEKTEEVETTETTEEVVEKKSRKRK